jgi:hypothetical protein
MGASVTFVFLFAVCILICKLLFALNVFMGQMQLN